MALGFRVRRPRRLPALVGVLALGSFLPLGLRLAHAADLKDLAARCNQIGQFARQVATARDQGIPKAAVLAKLPSGDSPARRTVEGIYRDRAVTPDQAAGLELTCLLDAGRVPPGDAGKP